MSITSLLRTVRACTIPIVLLASTASWGQCTWYTITVNDGVGAPDVTWELIDAMGVTWAVGPAPWEEDICLPDGCYTLLMYDSNGDGWDDINWFIEDWTGDFDWDTNLPDGPHGTDTFVLGENQPCDPVVIGAGCPPSTQALQFIVTNGTAPAQISWNVSLNGTPLFTGGANYNDTLCLDTGCYVLTMLDAGANGWQGATYTLKYFGGSTLFTGTLTTGASGTATWSIGGADCSTPGGGGPCANSGDPTGDCPTVVCVCDPYTFPITPSGFGSINEIPSPGSISNPAFGGLSPAPWGGTDYGCLLAAELNSSWMLFTIGSSGNLAFSFGAGGQQVGYYDWAMWPYTGPGTCAAIVGNSLPPVRCVWDAVPYGGAGLANTIPPGGDPGNYAPELPVVAGQQFIICMSNWSYVNATVTLNFFGSATIDCTTTLPIELTAFAAEAHGRDAWIQWATASEMENDHFDVERSSDGLHWSTIGTVSGAGTCQSAHSYELVDPAPPIGTDYYRLRQVDYDGHATYSETEAVEFAVPEGVSIWPQPNQGSFHVAGLHAPPILLDAVGRQVAIDVTPEPTIACYAVRIVEPAPGIYFMVEASSGGSIGRVLVSQ
ncbi:MAG: hypothetical protein KA175_02850 [Flavobacteriales bacterium]|nr:hypothetical protein [Flavobacteriales bacterium]MBP6696529.1 hypothetical protein [Flavobacteriales bacterium]